MNIVMKKRFVFTFVAVLVVLLVATVSAASYSVPMRAAAQTLPLPSGMTDEDIGQTLDGFLEQHAANHAAVATAVFRGDADLYTRYFGYIDAEGKVPLDADCVLEWGSTSKLLIWVSAMQLIEGGRLDVNADIRPYLPQGFLHNLRYDEPITMLHLMNHSAGFQETDFILEVDDERDIIPLGTYLSYYQPVQVFRPGDVVAYSNWGAALAAYIVECIADMPYSQYVQQHIFQPLGMTHTAIAANLGDNQWVKTKRADFVSYLPDGTLSEENNKVYILPYPSGMCTSTLEDFLRFAKALLRRDMSLLTPQGFEMLYAPSLLYTETDVPRAAHGFLIDYDFAVPIVGHDGNTMGGSSRLLLDLTDNVGMVVLTNQLGGSLYRKKMAELVFGVSDCHVQVDGYYVPARNVYVGPEKIWSNLFLIERCHITTALVDGMYVNVLPDRIELSSTDYLVPTVNYAAQDALAVIWFVLVGYVLVNMVVRVVCAIVAGAKGKPFDAHNTVNALYSLLQALSLLPLFVSIPSAVVLAYVVVTGCMGLGLCLYTALRTKTMMATRATRIAYFQSYSLLVVWGILLANLLVWDLMLL